MEVPSSGLPAGHSAAGSFLSLFRVMSDKSEQGSHSCLSVPFRHAWCFRGPGRKNRDSMQSISEKPVHLHGKNSCSPRDPDHSPCPHQDHCRNVRLCPEKNRTVRIRMGCISQNPRSGVPGLLSGAVWAWVSEVSRGKAASAGCLKMQGNALKADIRI